MKAVLLLALLALSSCDSATPGPAPVLPRERSIVIMFRDSLFAVTVDPQARPSDEGDVQLALGGGRYIEFGLGLESNQLAEHGQLITLVTDIRASSGGLTILAVPASNPNEPIRLGNPAGGLYTGVINNETGRAYGLVRSSAPSCSGWAVVRLGESTSQILACAENVPPDVNPQRMFVSADESVSTFSYIRRGRIIGDLQDMAVMTAGAREAEIFEDAGRIPLDMRWSAQTGDLYAVVYTDGEVFALTPGTGQRRTVAGPMPSLPRSRRLFLIDGALVTFTRTATETTIHVVDVQTETAKEFTIPGSFIQAYEHGGYLMFRQFAQGNTPQSGSPDVPAVETFVGVCASELRQPGGSVLPTETFHVTLPPFARQTAAFSHSFTCP